MKHKLNIGNGALQYDRVTGKYVSASTPTISIGYSLPANFSLQLFNVSTSKYDGGNYITFSYHYSYLLTAPSYYMYVRSSSSVKSNPLSLKSF